MNSEKKWSLITPLTILIQGASMAEKIPSWIERLLLPRLSEMTGEIRGLNYKVDALEKTMNGKFEAVYGKFEAVMSRIDSLEKRIPVVQELAEIKVRLSEVERKVAPKES